MFNNVLSECPFNLFLFSPFVHFWTPVSGLISQWLAGITISQLESHLDIATRQILSSCCISVSDAFTVNMNSKFLSYTNHCYPASTCVWLPFCLLSTEGPTCAPGRLVTLVSVLRGCWSPRCRHGIPLEKVLSRTFLEQAPAHVMCPAQTQRLLVICELRAPLTLVDT